MTGLWTSGRDTLADRLNDRPLQGAVRDAPRVADYLIHTRTVRVLDPDDTELVDRLAGVLYRERQHIDYLWERARRDARAVIEALRQP
jgi:hypothetical protein